MASRKIQVQKVEEPDVHTVEVTGMDNPALDSHDTVRSLAELISNESAVAEEDVPPSPGTAVCSTPAPVKSNGTTPKDQQNGIIEEDEELDIEEEGKVNFIFYLI